MSRARHIPSLLAACSVPLIAILAVATPAYAQAVVQSLPDPASADLNDALRRLSRNPDNVTALVDAGRASLALGDVSGALSFFNRAQARRPEDGRVLAGLGLVAVRRGEGVIAVQLFDNANAAGTSMAPVAAERGLAYDLIGNNARAQRLYRQALSREASDEVIRRLALSYAISGDEAASEATLLPLLQRQDRSAFRSRAFALAILGRDEEAITIAEAMLPPRLSGRLAPYLRYMQRLTRAQQAAAANLGRFPAATEIGLDTPQIAALDESASQVPNASAASRSSGDRLTPSGTALGPTQPVTVAQSQAPTPAPTPTSTPAPTPTLARSGELPAINTSEAVRAAEDAVQPVELATAQPANQPTVQPIGQVPVQAPVQATGQPEVQSAVPPRPPAREPSPIVAATMGEEAAFPAAEEARPSFSLSEPVVQTAPIPSAEPEPDPAQTVEQLGLAEAFADFTLPDRGLPVVPSAGAVDITAIEPAREVVAPEPEPEPAPPPPPAHPSRHWVQVATGQDLAAFRFDWRRIVRNADGALDGREAYTAPWNQTNRLFTGPFESRSAAQRFISELAEAGVDSFRFTSAAGERVVPLD